MSQTPPPFVPPPPPPMQSPDAQTAASIAKDARNALIFGIIGIFCFGFIFGFLAIRKANEALENINLYQVAQDKRGLAIAGKVLGIIDIVLWILGLILRFALR